MLYLETFFMLRGGAHDGALRPDCPAVVLSFAEEAAVSELLFAFPITRLYVSCARCDVV